MIPGGPLYGICIGNGHTREKIAKNLLKFGLNGSFRGALELGNSGNGLKKSANLMAISVFSQTLIFDQF